ncbi:transcriptional regulator of RNA polII, SAGA, subunit-domain-containing protein [Scheffersomyces xylosifermentans]|uniref:transcriptional regulator of RNA polII, SAGA, subunit-domain-containing protein n=1 Tax=Scheffersomyces xylosifermentans TaxID=1304137 RepID=UPI00315C7DF9
MTSQTSTATINPSNSNLDAGAANNLSPISNHTNGNIAPNNGVAPSGSATAAVSAKYKHNKRLELERLIREFQNKLGNDWEKYHETLSLFLIGRLSRNELVQTIKPILKDNLIKYHNKLLLLNFANSLKDSPADFANDFPSFWNKKAQKTSKVKSTQYEKLKSNIMGLPIKERRRIKNITRDSGKKGKLSAGITLARHSLLPKIPMIQDKEQQQLQVNNLVQWQQDVVNGINTPIATQNYELPEYDNLSRRILMTMREHGLTGGLNAPVLEVILLGLESHLKNIVESAIDVAKYRKNKYTNNDYIPVEPSSSKSETTNSKKRTFDEVEPSSSKDITLSIEDMYDTLEMFPHLIEPNGPRYRLANVMLENDDDTKVDYVLPPRPDIITVSNGTAAHAGASNPDGHLKVGDKVNTVGSQAGSEGSSVLHNGTANKPLMNGSVKHESESDSIVKKDADGKTIAAHHVQHAIPRSDAHIGSTDELKWVLHDLISTM